MKSLEQIFFLQPWNLETSLPSLSLSLSLSLCSLSRSSSYELGLSSPAEPKHAQWQEIPNWISVNLANYEFFGDHFNLSGRLTNLLSMKAIILNYLDHVTPDLAQQWHWWGQARSTLKLMTTILLAAGGEHFISCIDLIFCSIESIEWLQCSKITRSRVRLSNVGSWRWLKCFILFVPPSRWWDPGLEDNSGDQRRSSSSCLWLTHNQWPGLMKFRELPNWGKSIILFGQEREPDHGTPQLWLLGEKQLRFLPRYKVVKNRAR